MSNHYRQPETSQDQTGRILEFSGIRFFSCAAGTSRPAPVLRNCEPGVFVEITIPPLEKAMSQGIEVDDDDDREPVWTQDDIDGFIHNTELFLAR